MKKLVFIIFILTPILLNAQKAKFDFGFVVNAIKSNSTIEMSEASPFDDIVSTGKWGFELGFGLYCIKNNVLTFRFAPSASFEEEIILFQGPSSTRGIPSETIYLRLPLHFIITPIKDQFYLMTGFSSNICLQKEEEDPLSFLYACKNDYTFDLGIGYPVIIRSIKISPELKYSLGLNDVTEWSYSASIGNYRRNRLSLGFYITGN
jgi:hypothetical protein